MFFRCFHQSRTIQIFRNYVYYILTFLVWPIKLNFCCKTCLFPSISINFYFLIDKKWKKGQIGPTSLTSLTSLTSPFSPTRGARDCLCCGRLNSWNFAPTGHLSLFSSGVRVQEFRFFRWSSLKRFETKYTFLLSHEIHVEDDDLIFL